MYWILFTGLSLAVFVLVHSAVGLAAVLAARWLEPRMHRVEARSGKRWLTALRLLPFVAAVTMAGFFAAPAFLLYEPEGVEESLPLFLAVLAGTALVLLLHSVARTVHAVRVTRRAVRAWERQATPLPDSGAGMPVFCFPSEHPVMAVAGVWRARLFVSSRLRSLLTGEEFRAAVQHEQAHHRSGDLWLQWVVRALPDLCPGLGALRRLERMLMQKVEEAADASGVRQDPEQALALASALLKVARATSSPAGPWPVAAYLLPHGDGSALAQRVLRLTRGTNATAPVRQRRHAWIPAAGLAAIAIGGLTQYGPLLRHTHDLLEALVR